MLALSNYPYLSICPYFYLSMQILEPVLVLLNWLTEWWLPYRFFVSEVFRSSWTFWKQRLNLVSVDTLVEELDWEVLALLCHLFKFASVFWSFVGEHWSSPSKFEAAKDRIVAFRVDFAILKQFGKIDF